VEQILLEKFVASQPRPERERIVDVVQEGRSSKLGVNWRARLIVPNGKNFKHLAYLSLLTVSRNTRRGNKKKRGLWKPEFDSLKSAY
jgi:hypothetical protein